MAGADLRRSGTVERGITGPKEAGSAPRATAYQMGELAVCFAWPLPEHRSGWRILPSSPARRWGVVRQETFLEVARLLEPSRGSLPLRIGAALRPRKMLGSPCSRMLLRRFYRRVMPINHLSPTPQGAPPSTS